LENDRIVTHTSLSRENSREKHVSVNDSDEALPGMPTREQQQKHKQFEEQRKRHYEMKNVKDMLGHPESMDDEDEDEDTPMSRPVPNRGINGGP